MKAKEVLAQGTLLFDGAMGTYFAELEGAELSACEPENLHHPEKVLAIHRAYLRAGCQAIKTNTFAANPRSLECSLEEYGERNQHERQAFEPYGIGDVVGLFFHFSDKLRKEDIACDVR